MKRARSPPNTPHRRKLNHATKIVARPLLKGPMSTVAVLAPRANASRIAEMMISNSGKSIHMPNWLPSRIDTSYAATMPSSRASIPRMPPTQFTRKESTATVTATRSWKSSTCVNKRKPPMPR